MLTISSSVNCLYSISVAITVSPNNWKRIEFCSVHSPALNMPNIMVPGSFSASAEGFWLIYYFSSYMYSMQYSTLSNNQWDRQAYLLESLFSKGKLPISSKLSSKGPDCTNKSLQKLTFILTFDEYYIHTAKRLKI